MDAWELLSGRKPIGQSRAEALAASPRDQVHRPPWSQGSLTFFVGKEESPSRFPDERNAAGDEVIGMNDDLVEPPLDPNPPDPPRTS